jgi:hypothetical protein
MRKFSQIPYLLVSLLVVPCNYIVQFFDLLRWKASLLIGKINSQESSIAGAFSKSNPVALEFRKNRLHCARTFSMKFADHHFEK